jgi:ribokinase
LGGGTNIPHFEQQGSSMNTTGQIDSVRNVFEKLRTHAGLTVERLTKTGVTVDPLLSLDVINRGHGKTVSPATIVDVVVSLAEQLPPTDLLIVDMTLALGIVRKRVGDVPEVESLYADRVGDRRAALLAGWARLHELLGVADAPAAPGETSLRTSRESESLKLLATLCVEGPAGVLVQNEPEAKVAVDPGETIGSVAIVGGAVLDLIFVVDDFPAPGTSTQGRFERHAGGKGLNLAVAAQRMGMAANLVTAIGDDPDADAIHAYLDEEGLNREFVLKKAGEPTPVTGVIVTNAGEASYVGSRSENQVSLSSAEMKRFRSALDRADAVLVTFESATDIVGWALNRPVARDKRPLVILQPSPPLLRPRELHDQLKNVDYLVGREWEIRRLLSDAGAGLDIDAVARYLRRQLGVGAVCVVEQFRCRIWSEWLTDEISSPGGDFDDSPGSREAFSAALMRRLLLQAARTPARDDLEWAVAAMSCTVALGRIAKSMPRPEDVDRILTLDESSG